MALTSSSRGEKPAGTLAILLGLVLLAVVIAMAAKSNKVIPVGPQPTPSVTSSK